MAAVPHYVFAHYMVCYACYGDTVAAYQREIQDAQAAGIDGFALDVGEWNGPDTYYKTRTASIFQAAENLGTGFKLFFSVDMNVTNDIVQMVSAYANRTNAFHYNGNLVLSSFGQNTIDWPNGVFAPLKNQGINVFFVPYFITEGYSYQNMGAGANALLAKYPYLDGLFQFGVGLPTDIIFSDNAYSQACRATNKFFMAGCSPSYWGCAQLTTGRTYFESQGGEGLVPQWTWLIQNQPDWVEILTWNDLNESTYINPLPAPDQFNQTPPTRYSHTGYLELSKRYITWYKTGRDPGLTNDALYYFYRTHSTNAVASNTNDIPVSVLLGNVQDVIYTTVNLISPATLVVASGGINATNSLPAGTSSLRFPFHSGHQNLSVLRNGNVIMSVQGPDILSQITNYDYFPASGYVNNGNQPSPPENLHIVPK